MEPVVERYYEWHKGWIKTILRIGREQTDQFENASEAYVTDLIEFEPRRKMMMWIYHDLVKEKRLLPVEEYDKETKTRMWLIIKEMVNGRTDDKRKIIEIVKTMYLIEYFINEYNQRPCS